MNDILAVVETGIYADDLDQAAHFYRDVLGLPLIAHEAGRHVFFRVGAASMLLVFAPASTLKGDHLPAHGRAGQGTSPSASRRMRWITGGSACGRTASPSSRRWRGRAAVIRCTSATRRATRWNC